MITYITRYCISIAITEMVRSHARNLNDKMDSEGCPFDDDDPFNPANFRSAHFSGSGEFSWSEETQGIVLSSFFWGYLLINVPTVMMRERVGGKYTLGAAVLVSALCSILTPVTTRSLGAWGLVALRVVMGLGQGFVYPSVNALLAKWISAEERGHLDTLVFAGANLGNFVCMSLSGMILSWTDGAWPILFYLYGGAGLLWLWLWAWYGYSKPDLSLEETLYLEMCSAKLHMRKELPPTPWRSILTSVPLWGLLVAQVGHNWGLFTILTILSKYLKSAMHFSIAETGVRSGLPYMAMWVATLSGGLVDLILAKKIIAVTASRMVFTTVAIVGPALGIIGTIYAGCDKQTATLFLTLGLGFMGFFYFSLNINCLNLSPNYAETIITGINGIGVISGIFAPYLNGLLITDNTMEQWRHVFVIVAGALVVTYLVYIGTASGEVQPWNDPPSASASGSADPRDETNQYQ